jgi:ketosteroid isomerase-like protein
MNQTLPAISAIGALVLVACNQDQEMSLEVDSADYQAIQEQTNAWIDVAATGDVDGYFDFVTDDFIWLGDDSGPGYSGRQEVQAFIEPFFDTLVFSMENVASEGITFSADGKDAIHRYYGTAIIESKADGQITKINRRYVDFWRKGEGGIWRCSRHLFLVVE